MLRTTKTENGLVRGLTGTNARITVFKGIPLCRSPVGENRWRAPQSAEDWEGVRECYEFGPIYYQKIPGKAPDAFYSKEWHVAPRVSTRRTAKCLAPLWTASSRRNPMR